MSIMVDGPVPSTAPDTDAIVPSIGKRKRSDTADDNPVSATAHNNHHDPPRQQDVSAFSTLLLDLLEVLKSCDTVPSILDHPIPTPDSTEEHPAKRARLTPLNSTDSIASRVTSKSYTDIDELIADVSAVASAMTSGNELIAPDVAAFQKELEALIAHENLLENGSLIRSVADDGNPIKNEDFSSLSSNNIASRGSQTVLTLYGAFNQAGYQLWSTPRESGVDNDVIDAFQSSLPERFSTTSVLPVHSLQPKQGDEKSETIGELFASSHLPRLEAPKQSTHSAPRSSSVGWIHPADHSPQRPINPRASFWDQRLETGKWLSYNVAPAQSQLVSAAAEKRRQRERALSSGKASTEMSEEDFELLRLKQARQQEADDDALFKSVYSSFAPSHDNTAAVIPHQLRSRLWWHKIFESRDRKLNELYPDIWEDADALDQNGSNEPKPVDEITNFKEAIEYLEQEEASSPWPANLLGEDKPDRDTQEILDDISNLLETLSSHQKIRHESFVHSQNKALAELIGTPTTPSAAEFDIYEMLKSQLAILVANLPPYAVAKLNGDQLEALNISTKIRVQTANHRGTLKSREALKPQAQPVATPAQVAARPQSTTVPRQPNYPQGVNVPTQAQRQQSFSAPRPGYPQQGYGYAQRPQATPTQYSNYAQQPPGNRHAVYAGQYAQQATPVQNAQYTNGTRHYATPNGYPMQYNTAAAQYNATAGSPSASRSMQYGAPRPAQPNFPQRPQPTQGYANQPHNYQGQQQRYPQAMQTPQQIPQQTPQRPTYSQAQPNAATSQQANGTPGTLGHYHGLSLSPGEQEQLIERQRMKIANAQQMPRGPQPMGGQPPTPVPQTNGTYPGGIAAQGQ